MKLTASPISYHGAVVIFALSFWSSGVMLIRAFDKLHIWSPQSPLLILVYILSIPVIFISVRGVQKLFTSTRPAVQQITGLVLICHAVALTLFPTLYLFTSSPALSGVAWLLWFGGVVMVNTKAPPLP